MSDVPGPVRSYQRIFRPDRRIHAVDGRQIPVPGGVPLRWLAYAAATAVTVIVLSAGSRGLAVLLAALAAAAARHARGGRVGTVAAASVLVAVPVAGRLLGAVDWPLRFLVLPALVATLGTQPTPDGRPAHRYVLSLLGLWMRSPRRSLRRPLPESGLARRFAPAVRVAPDEHAPELRHARVRGRARVHLPGPMLASRHRGVSGRRTVRVRPLDPPRRWGRAEAVVDSVELRDGECLRVRA